METDFYTCIYMVILILESKLPESIPKKNIVFVWGSILKSHERFLSKSNSSIKEIFMIGLFLSRSSSFKVELKQY